MLTTTRTAHVVTAVMMNPPMNYLNHRLVQELDELVRDVASDPSVRVLVLTGGVEGIFITHYDVGELSHVAERGASPKRTDATLRDVQRALEALDAITVAAINGNAMGGGCELALACDFRVMASGEHLFGLPETTVGLIPGGGGTQRFARLLGTARALDLICYGSRLGPDAALAIGLVHRVFDDFESQTVAFVEDLASRAPIALAAAKRAIRDGAERGLEDGLTIEAEQFTRTMASKDAQRAMRHYLGGASDRFEFTGE